VIGLDTNVLVRYLVEDDPAQSARAARLITAAAQSGEQLLVTAVVLCELTWVLAAGYKTPKHELLMVLRNLLRARQLTFESQDVLIRAIDAFEKGRGDLSDYVIREAARAAGCPQVVTFDKALLKEPGFAPV
jgi:predicted nucleic-acid-binding protein